MGANVLRSACDEEVAAGRLVLLMWVVVVYNSQVQLQAMAAVYEVGGPMGWTNYNVQANRIPNYDVWSSTLGPFYPGDQFLFEYIPHFHTIHQFSNKSDYEQCDFKHATQLDSGLSGAFWWEAMDANTFYFGCKTSVEGFGYLHCNGGQKVAITIQENLPSSPLGV